MTIERLPASSEPGRVAEALARDGCVVVEDLLPDDRRARVTRELDPFVEATRQGNDEFTGRETRRTGGLIARSPTSRSCVVEPEQRESSR